MDDNGGRVTTGTRDREGARQDSTEIVGKIRFVIIQFLNDETNEEESYEFSFTPGTSRERTVPYYRRVTNYRYDEVKKGYAEKITQHEIRWTEFAVVTIDDSDNSSLDDDHKTDPTQYGDDNQ